MPSAQLLLRGFERERLRRLVVEHLSALHGLGAVGDRLHELGYLLVFLGELGILDDKLVDERGERGGICRIGSARPLVTVYLLCISVCITLCIGGSSSSESMNPRIKSV